MTSFDLPWERGVVTSDRVNTGIPPVEQTPEPPVTRPTPAESAQKIDLGDQVSVALREAFRESFPQIQKTLIEYMKDATLAKMQGKEVSPWPNITATTPTGGQLVIADARNRSFRTFWQGLSIDIVMALVGLLSMLANMNFFDKTAWITFGALVVKTLLQTVVSYVSRLKITPQTIIQGETVKLQTVAVPKVS